MGSLSPQLPSPTPISRIYASFCSTNPSSHANRFNWIECYDPSTNAWHRVTTIPGLLENHVLKGFSMVAVGDFIYVVGGRLCHKTSLEQNSEEVVEVNLEVLSSVLCYNVRDGVWSKCSPMRVPRFDFACGVCDGRICAAGGQSTLSTARGLRSAEVYDPALDQWKALPDMSMLRYKCVGVTWQRRFHVVGGFAERGDSSSDGAAPPWGMMERSSAEVYSCDDARWELIKKMWQLDVPPNQIVAVDDKLFSSGDCFKSWKGHIEEYDGKLNMWNEVDGSHLETLSSPISPSDEEWPPIQRLYITMAPIGTQLFFLAGYRLPGELPRVMCNVHVFDTSADGYGWTSLEPMEEEGEKELCSHCCVVRHTL